MGREGGGGRTHRKGWSERRKIDLLVGYLVQRGNLTVRN